MNEFMCEFMDGFVEGIHDRSAQLETNGAFRHNLSEIKKTFRYSFKEFDDILPSGLIPRDPNALVADEADLYREAIEQMEREIMWGKGQNYPKLDIEAMYKTPGR